MAQLEQKCLTPLKICALRATRLDADGTPAAGPNNSYVTNRITELALGTEVRTGDEQELLDGCGCPILEYQEDDSFKRWTFGLSLGSLEFGLFEMLLGTPLILDDSDIPVPIGLQFNTPASCGAVRPKVALEVWSKAIAYDDQDPDKPWFHWVFPAAKFNPAPDSLTLGAAAAPMVLNGRGVQNARFGDPYAELEEEPDASGQVFLATTFPTPECGFQTIGSS